MPNGQWLDPPPEHSEHSEIECRRTLPEPRSIDVGRRWQCGLCGRVYRVFDSQRDGRGYEKITPRA